MQASHSNEFIAGYLQSKLESFFPFSNVELAVQEGQVILYRYPADEEQCQSIRDFLEEQVGCPQVTFDESYRPSTSICLESAYLTDSAINEGNWLPELTPFFPTMLADPRMIGYSAGYRTYDRIFKTPLLPVSMGDQFSIYQFKDRGIGCLHLGIEAGVWAIFEAKPKSLALINADYYIGLPITYLNGQFSARLRIYHESSHLGDELLIEKKYIRRLNPSMEAVDLFVAYEFNKNLTVFGGVGRIIRSDESYRVKPYYIVYGFNCMVDAYKIRVGNLEATPYIGVYLSNWEDHHWELDRSIAIGYQWDKSYGRKIRLNLEYHDGHSLEGQFSKSKTRYLALKLIYGY